MAVPALAAAVPLTWACHGLAPPRTAAAATSLSRLGFPARPLVWPRQLQKAKPAAGVKELRSRRQNGGRAVGPPRAAYIAPPATLQRDADRGDDSIEPAQDPLTHLKEPLRASPQAREAARQARSAAVLTWGSIMALVVTQRLRILVAVAALVGGTCCTLVMPQFSGQFFETLIGKRQGKLGRLLGSLAIVYVMEPIFTVAYVTSMCTAWEAVMAKLRTAVFQRLLVQKASLLLLGPACSMHTLKHLVEFYDKHKVGELQALLSTELGYIEKIVSENVSRDRGFRALSEVLGTLAILFTLSRELAPILGLLILGVSAGVAVYKRTTAPVFKAHAAAQARISECANETFGAIRTVRSFGGEMRQYSMFGSQVEAYRQSGTTLSWLRSANESWTRIAIYVSLLVVYYLGGSKVKAGELPIGTMVSFIGYTFTLTFAVQGLVNTLADLRSVLSAVGRVNNVAGSAEFDDSLAIGLAREAMGELESCKDIKPPTLQPTSSDRPLESAGSQKGVQERSVCELAWTGDVTLEGVYFAYPLRPDAYVLKGINLRLRAESVTALVGSSGAGKSTVVQLLSRFYEPVEGRIALANWDVRSFDKSEWAKAVSLVNQEPVLFAMSVKDNIAYGLPNDEVSHEDVVAAAKAANAHDFVERLPQGYDTLVGERGSLLSGGQRQRVAIARALLKNSPILILDEATSALDSLSERLVQDALERLMKGRTTLVIAHRLSTVQAADQIAVLSNGEVIELGSHAQLISKQGAYANLVHSQRLTFE
eukprot:SM000067S20297  [mRNA]  locus=s67:139842:145263:+ [translate_table: standard]